MTKVAIIHASPATIAQSGGEGGEGLAALVRPYQTNAKAGQRLPFNVTKHYQLPGLAVCFAQLDAAMTICEQHLEQHAEALVTTSHHFPFKEKLC